MVGSCRCENPIKVARVPCRTPVTRGKECSGSQSILWGAAAWGHASICRKARERRPGEIPIKAFVRTP
jgi:hypothetical protein